MSVSIIKVIYTHYGQICMALGYPLLHPCPFFKNGNMDFFFSVQSQKAKVKSERKMSVNKGIKYFSSPC